MTEEERLRNALLWIRQTAGLHYWGQAFDPEHMRTLANAAADALAGKELPDYWERMEAARIKGLEWAEEFKKYVEDD